MATWDVELPPERALGDTGHLADHEALKDAIVEARANVDAAALTATWGSVANRPSTFAPAAHDHPVTADAGSGLAAAATVQALGVALSNRIKSAEGSITSHNHAVTADSGSGLAAASTVQALAVALSTRIKAVETSIAALEGRVAALESA